MGAYRRGVEVGGRGWRTVRVRVRVRSQSLGGEEWRGVPGESQIRRGAGGLSAIKSRRRGATRVQKRGSVALGEKRSAPGSRATEEAVRALSLDCSEKSRDRCSSGDFNRRVCEIASDSSRGEYAAEMLYGSSR